MLLKKTLIEISMIAQQAANIRTRTVCTMIYDAIFGSVVEFKQSIINPDIKLIEELIKRVDGAVPEEKELDNYANILGETLNTIMNKQSSDSLEILPDDLGIEGLAKALIITSIDQETGRNQTRKRDRQVATEIILNRCGGRKNEPTKKETQIKFVEPEWAKSLNSAE